MEAEDRIAFMKKIGRIKEPTFEKLVMAIPSQEVKKKSITIDKSKIKSKTTYEEENKKIIKDYLNPAIKEGNMGDVRDAMMLYNQLRKKYGLEPKSNKSLENFYKILLKSKAFGRGSKK